MNVEVVNKIKKITLIALASDDRLMETLVLKGGNAIDLAYRPDHSTLSRTSYDLDYSLTDGDFDEDEVEVSERIKRTLEQTFSEYSYVVIDFKFMRKPSHIRAELADFWGGYYAEFKVVNLSVYQKHKGDNKSIRLNSIAVKPTNSTRFEIDFSKFEYVGQKTTVELEGYKIYVYTPEMIVFEKLRAICQQLPQYSEVVPSFSPRARARDFYDIHLIMEMHEIDPQSPSNLELIEHVFEAKKVPLKFIKEIKESKFQHLDNWKQVEDSLSANDRLEKDFDYYFNFVIDKFNNLTFP